MNNDWQDESHRMNGHKIIVPSDLTEKLASVAIQVLASHVTGFRWQSEIAKEHVKESLIRHFERVIDGYRNPEPNFKGCKVGDSDFI